MKSTMGILYRKQQGSSIFGAEEEEEPVIWFPHHYSGGAALTFTVPLKRRGDSRTEAKRA